MATINTEAESPQPDTTRDEATGFAGAQHPPAWPWLVTILIAQAVLVGRFVWNGWFFSDDFLFLRQGLDEPLSVEYLRLGLFEHFSPVHRFIDWAFIRSVGLSWPAAAGLLVLLAAACTLSFFYMTSPIVRDGRIVLAATALYSVSLFFVRNAVWWTGGIHLMLVTIFTLLCIGGFARWLTAKNPVSLALSIVALAVALLTHEHALLIIGYLALLRLLVLTPRITSLRSAVQAIRDEWFAWTAYLALTLVGAVNFLVNHYGSSPRPASGDMIRYAWYTVAEGFFSTLFLTKVPEARIASPAVSGALALALGIAVIVGTMILRRRAWRPWLAFFISFSVASLALGLNRTVQFGATIGREPRYHMAFAALFLLCFAVALDGAPRRSTPKLRPLISAAIVVVLALVYVGAFLRAAPRIARMDGQVPATREYFDRFEDDVEAVRSSGQEPVIGNATMPANIVPTFLAPFNRFDSALGLFDPALHFDAGRVSHTVDPTGRLVPVEIETTETIELLNALPSGWVADGDAKCAQPPSSGGEVRFAAGDETSVEMRVVQVTYSATDTVHGTFIVVNADGQPISRRISLPADETVADLYVDSPTLSEIVLLFDDSSVCVASAGLANLVMRDG